MAEKKSETKRPTSPEAPRQTAPPEAQRRAEVIRHEARLRVEEGEETEHGAEIRAREPEEGSPPEELGLEETTPA